MFVRTVVRGPDGVLVELRSGELIGRLPTCGLRVDDGRISEAHGIVSLRGGQLWLLALRGRFAVKGAIVERVALEPGLTVALADGVELHVEEVVLPDEVMALELPGQAPQVLSGTTTLMAQPEPTLRGGWHADGVAWFWTVDEAWRVRVGASGSTPVVPGEALQLSGVRVLPTLVPLDDAGVPHTSLRVDDFAPLRVHARFHSVHLSRGAREALVLTGPAARVISELVALDGPVDWQIPAREIWGRGEDEALLRGRWDAVLSRLRKRLRSAGIREDLVKASRQGTVELLLGREDVVVDDT